jgi:pyruvate/2-oxoglutarate/acetoin dehydrogenase E1 component
VINTCLSNITADMTWLAQQDKVVFLGEGLLKGDRIYNTMQGVGLSKCLEMPIAENLIMGCAIGLALEGWKPVVIFQRMDFMLIAADQIINHLALIPEMSNGQFKPFVMIRAGVGSQCAKFDVGAQHRHDFRGVFSPYIETHEYNPEIYRSMFNLERTCIIIERKDMYDRSYLTPRT